MKRKSFKMLQSYKPHVTWLSWRMCPTQPTLLSADVNQKQTVQTSTGNWSLWDQAWQEKIWNYQYRTIYSNTKVFVDWSNDLLARLGRNTV